MSKDGVEAYKEFETDIIPPSWKDRTWSKVDFKKWYETTVKDKKAVEEWWGKWANELPWFKKWDRVLDDRKPHSTDGS